MAESPPLDDRVAERLDLGRTEPLCADGDPVRAAHEVVEGRHRSVLRRSVREHHLRALEHGGVERRVRRHFVEQPLGVEDPVELARQAVVCVERDRPRERPVNAAVSSLDQPGVLQFAHAPVDRRPGDAEVVDQVALPDAASVDAVEQVASPRHGVTDRVSVRCRHRRLSDRGNDKTVGRSGRLYK